ncbi:neuronal PAS domain-containing protein 4 [Phymastichus coffea]|uniref:neuronal PAS domain-containing protein 4 n=1 Tax=Phymastichus coffea TaxID=108790 RepID=UPI00273C9E20|nr:neuronal PAS domain-containing protein 4 [Phymastichus coffea]
MFNRIDASKSTKGASKLRRDLINAEIANLRDLLPLPPSTRQRLSQLQLMALVCVFLRKANYFQHVLKKDQESASMPTPNIGFSKAMSGFIMMMTQQGKLLYISENAAEYLGHSMEDLLIHGDSVYDVVDKQDHMVIQNQLARSSGGPGSGVEAAAVGNNGAPGTATLPNDRRLFLCRINVSRNSRRQLRFGDQKVVLVEGRYLPFALQSNRSESVFLASCTPVVLPETRESVVQGATNIFTTIHSMDMKYLHIDKTAESHMEYSRSELVGVSWYNLLHWDSIRTAYCKHQTVIQSDQERSSTALLRIQSRSGRWFWVHCVLQVKDTSEECQHPIIVCTNQVLSEREAEILRASSWLYQYSSQSKFTYGVCPQLQAAAGGTTATTATTANNTTASAVAPIAAQPSLGYGPEVVDYNGRPAATAAALLAIPYGLPPTELDIATYQASSSSHVAVVDDNAQLGHWPKDRTTLVKQEPTEVYGDSSIQQQQQPLSSRTYHHAGQGATAPADNTAEPVDMSINNTATEQQQQQQQQQLDDRHSVPHCHNQAAAEFCPCNKPYVTMVQRNNKSPSRPMSSSNLTYLRASNKTISQYLAPNQSPQQSPTQPQPLQQLSPGMAPSPDHNGTPKYNIVDLDKLGHPNDQHHIDVYGPTYSQKRQLLLLHQTKVQAPLPPAPGLEPHPCITDPSHHHHHHHLALHHTYGYEVGQDQWSSPTASASPTTTVVLPQQQHQPAQLWPDCGLQRVPDVVHQELSPYITTPTTPVDTPDDSSTDYHTPETPVSVFNFDWPVEQHVPNLRVLSFRTPGYVDTRRPSFQEVQPITLQLPRKKNLHTESTGHRDYAK